jgi:prepilin-type N-terminal cleavage/methylation domain-containing protein
MSCAFSLVELLVVIAVLGVILYFAFPNVIRVRSDSEKEAAKARAEALNIAAAAYFQAKGPASAASDWSGKTSEQRYQLLQDYIAFPAATLSNFLPSSDYSITFNPTSPHRVKATLTGPGGTIAY